MLINSNIIWFRQNIPFIRDVERKSKVSFIIFSKAESGTNPKGFFEDLNPQSRFQTPRIGFFLFWPWSKIPHSGYARDSRIISLRYVTSRTRDFISGIYLGFFGWSLQINRLVKIVIDGQSNSTWFIQKIEKIWLWGSKSFIYYQYQKSMAIFSSIS